MEASDLEPTVFAEIHHRRPGHERQLFSVIPTLATAGVSVVGFAALAYAARSAVAVQDVQLGGALQREHFEELLRPLDYLASAPAWAIVVAVVAIVLWKRGARSLAVGLVLVHVSAESIVFLTKALTSVGLPSVIDPAVLTGIAEAPFPSAHVARVSASLLVMRVCVKLEHGWVRLGASTLIASFIALVAIQRVAAGDHLPSAVVAGFLVGLAWADICLALARTAHIGPAPATARSEQTFEPACRCDELGQSDQDAAG
jgi:undecaprenyl-diphosphatase